MRLTEAFRAALENLSAHKLRSGLTMLGMIFGVGAVIAMLSIGAGAELQALALIDRLGVRNVVVRAKELQARRARRGAQEVARRLAARRRGDPRGGPRRRSWSCRALQIDAYKILSRAGQDGGEGLRRLVTGTRGS